MNLNATLFGELQEHVRAGSKSEPAWQNSIVDGTRIYAPSFCQQRGFASSQANNNNSSNNTMIIVIMIVILTGLQARQVGPHEPRERRVHREDLLLLLLLLLFLFISFNYFFFFFFFLNILFLISF